MNHARMLMSLAGIPPSDDIAREIEESAPQTKEEVEWLTRSEPRTGQSLLVDYLLMAEARAKTKGQAQMLTMIARHFLGAE